MTPRPGREHEASERLSDSARDFQVSPAELTELDVVWAAERANGTSGSGPDPQTRQLWEVCGPPPFPPARGRVSDNGGRKRPHPAYQPLPLDLGNLCLQHFMEYKFVGGSPWVSFFKFA